MIEPTAGDTFVRLHKIVQASSQKVYETWLDADTYPKWFAADPKVQCKDVSIEARVGGEIRIVMQTAEGEITGVGQFLELEPGKKIVHTWLWEEMPEFGGNSTLRIELHETDNPHGQGPATEIVLTHEKLNTPQERSEHTGGWWSTLRALGYFVRGIDPREAMYSQPAHARP